MSRTYHFNEKDLNVTTHGIVPDYETYKHVEMHEMSKLRNMSKTPSIYSFLQILIATFASFAHGSNDDGPTISNLWYLENCICRRERENTSSIVDISNVEAWPSMQVYFFMGIT